MKANKLNEKDIIYFLLTDRFYKHGERSDDMNLEGRPEFDPTSLVMYNGGTWEGITQKLDYIKNLGATAIWISPVSKNEPMFMQESAFAEASYTGYMTKDYSSLNEHFGNEQDLKRLSDEIEARGMKLILDVVPNHLADYLVPGEEKWHDERRPAEPFDKFECFNHAGLIKNWECREELEVGSMGFLADLKVQDPQIADLVCEKYKDIVEKFNASGVRVDAALCLPYAFLEKFEKELDLPSFGEIFCGKPEDLTVFTEKMWGCLDFPLLYEIVNVFARDYGVDKFEEVFSKDKCYKNPSHMVTFIDSHDRDRFLSISHDDHRRLRMALAMIFACRGVPVVYYGTECNLYGSDGSTNDAGITSKYNREMMPKSSFDTQQHTYSYIKRLAEIRRNYRCFTEGEQVQVMQNNGIYAFARVKDDERVLAIFNNTDQAKDVELSVDKLNGFDQIQYINMLDPKMKVVCSETAGDAKITIKFKMNARSAALVAKADEWNLTLHPLPEINKVIINLDYEVEGNSEIWVRGTTYPLFSETGIPMYKVDGRWQCEIERLPEDNTLQYWFVERNTKKDEYGNITQIEELRWSPIYTGAITKEGPNNFEHSGFEDRENVSDGQYEAEVTVLMDVNEGASLILRGDKGELTSKEGVALQPAGEGKWKAKIHGLNEADTFKFRLCYTDEVKKDMHFGGYNYKKGAVVEKWFQETYEGTVGTICDNVVPKYYAKAYLFAFYQYDEYPGYDTEQFGKHIGNEPGLIKVKKRK